jgi:hypothetical protein
VSLVRDGVEIFHDEAAESLVSRNAARTAGKHPAALHGRVIDAAGHGLAGSIINAVDFGRIAIANDSGAFTIAGLPANKVVFEILREGFQEVRFAIALRPDVTSNVSATLVARDAMQHPKSRYR